MSRLLSDKFVVVFLALCLSSALSCGSNPTDSGTITITLTPAAAAPGERVLISGYSVPPSQFAGFTIQLGPAEAAVLNDGAGGLSFYAPPVFDSTVLWHVPPAGAVDASLRQNGLEVAAAADELRRDVCGDTVSYVVNRNINYTNVCYFKCTFCAFSKGKASTELRGAPYLLDLEEIGRRSAEAWQRGATEVCMQGGIHPDFTGRTYIDIVKAVKAAAPDIHVHAFSPLEITQGAATLSMSVSEFLGRLGEAGLASLPGTAAEILDDHVRARLCPDKIDTAQWLHVVESAHQVGLPTTATIMFGHLEGIDSWATHLLTLRALQARSGGLTELVPLPFVPMEAPLYRRGGAPPRPTYREVVLLHAVARLVLHPLITNIQVSWPKLGPAGAAQLLHAGVNDLGGTLMNESISRAAGARHGQELPVAEMEALIVAAGRQPRQRNTLYGRVSAERRAAARTALAMAPVVNRPLRDYQRAR